MNDFIIICGHNKLNTNTRNSTNTNPAIKTHFDFIQNVDQLSTCKFESENIEQNIVKIVYYNVKVPV